MSQICISGTFQEAQQGGLPPCFSKPVSTVWSLHIPVPSSLATLGSLTYTGPSFHGALLLQTTKGMKMRVVASEPPTRVLPASLTSKTPFPILSLSLPLNLNHKQETYQLRLYFTRLPSLATHYSVGLLSQLQPLSHPFDLSFGHPSDLGRPACTLFFQADPLLKFPLFTSSIAYYMFLKQDSLPFSYTCNLHDGTSYTVEEKTQTVIHLPFSFLKHVESFCFSTNPPYMLRISNK